MALWQRVVRMQGGTRGQRVGIRLAFVAVTLAAVAMLTPIATAHAAQLTKTIAVFLVRLVSIAVRH